MKKIIFPLLLAILLGSSYIEFHNLTSNDFINKSGPEHRSVAKGIASPSTKEMLKVETATSHCGVDAPLFDTSKQFIPIDPQIVENKLAEAYRNPQRIIEDRNNSAVSAIALFQLVSSCFPGARKADSSNVQNVGCPDIAIDKIISAHPIEILEKPAEQGSVDAKIAYMMNASGAAAQLRRLGTARGDELAREITMRSERYGQEAARAGSQDAMRYMSFAYEQGKFGARDMQMAYTFSLPLSIEGTSNDVKRASELGAKLEKNQRNEAKIAALGCARVSKPGILNNPFG